MFRPAVYPAMEQFRGAENSSVAPERECFRYFENTRDR